MFKDMLYGGIISIPFWIGVILAIFLKNGWSIIIGMAIMTLLIIFEKSIREKVLKWEGE